MAYLFSQVTDVTLHGILYPGANLQPDRWFIRLQQVSDKIPGALLDRPHPNDHVCRDFGRGYDDRVVARTS